MPEGPPRHRRRMGHVLERRRLRGPVEVVQQPGRLFAEGLLARARQAPTAAPSGAFPQISGRGSSGASVTTRWQLVPPMPNELTPATSGLSGRGPAAGARVDPEAQVVEGDVGVGVLVVEAGRGVPGGPRWGSS